MPADLNGSPGSGTGLGLEIARMIAEMHGARIWFESSPGRGTEFHSTLPVQVRPSRELRTFAQSSGSAVSGEKFFGGAGAGTRTPDPRFKARPELRRTPPHASCCIRFSASRLPVAPRGTPAWQYKLAIHPKEHLAIARRARTPNGKGPSQPRSVGRLPWRS
jgi:hypothetical protein